jgi:hypothetical protein
MENEYAVSLKTNRLIRKDTANYRKLKKMNLVREVDKPSGPPNKPETVPIPVEEPESEPVLAVDTAKRSEPEFDESKLQSKLAEISTDMIKKNIKTIVKSQKLTDSEMDLMLKKMLYKKLMEPEPVKPVKKTKKKSKFKIVEPPSSSESESD